MTPSASDDTFDFPFCPRPPDWSLDWSGIIAAFDWVRAMEGCPQDPVWHAEGDVLTHTRMVCDALIRLDAWRSLAAEDRAVVFAATLMHDIAKPLVTRKERGRIRSPRHAAKGANIARSLLMTELLPTTSARRFRLREQIVSLVRHHGLPLYFLDGGDPKREVLAASQVAQCNWLAMIAQADVMGRVSQDLDELLGRVEFFRDFSKENGCYDGPRRFASDHTRLLYFEGRDLDPGCEAYDDTKSEVIVMSGLPGSGKDHWLEQHGPNWPIVSLDEIRQQLRVDPEDNQGIVVSEAKERAREHLRTGESFVWNATNTTRSLRQQIVRFMRDYNARARIVYVEAEWSELLRRNQSRTDPVPESVLDHLASKLDVPNRTEAHRIDFAVAESV